MFLSRSEINSLRIISVAHDRKHAHIKRSTARSHERLGWFFFGWKGMALGAALEAIDESMLRHSLGIAS